MGGGGRLTSEKLEKKIAELNQRLKEQSEDKKLAESVKVMKKDYLPLNISADAGNGAIGYKAV